MLSRLNGPNSDGETSHFVVKERTNPTLQILCLCIVYSSCCGRGWLVDEGCSVGSNLHPQRRQIEHTGPVIFILQGWS